MTQVLELYCKTWFFKPYGFDHFTYIFLLHSHRLGAHSLDELLLWVLLLEWLKKWELNLGMRYILCFNYSLSNRCFQYMLTGILLTYTTTISNSALTLFWFMLSGWIFYTFWRLHFWQNCVEIYDWWNVTTRVPWWAWSFKLQVCCIIDP